MARYSIIVYIAVEFLRPIIYGMKLPAILVFDEETIVHTTTPGSIYIPVCKRNINM